MSSNGVSGQNPFPLPTSNSRAVQQHLFSLLNNNKTPMRMRDLAQIHAQIVLNGYTQKNFVLSKLLFLLISSGNLHHAHQAFQHIHSPSTPTCNHIIRAFSLSPTPHQSLLTYTTRMQPSPNAHPDTHTFSFLLASCSAMGPSLAASREGEQIHARVVSGGFYSNVFVQTNLVNMYYCSGRDGEAANKARRVFDEMPQRSVVTWNSMLAGLLRLNDVDAARKVFDDMPERNVVSWTTMVAEFARSGKCKQALVLFREMRRANVEPDQVALVAALSACAELGDVELGRWIHAYSNSNSLLFQQGQQQRLVSLDNALIHMYAKCGLVEEAYRIFREMPRRSTVSWTTMITGFAMHGRGEDALAIFKQMVNTRGVEPDDVTFIGVLCACSHAGLVDEGRRYFEMMIRECRIEPRIEHYGCMVDLLSRAGLLDEAYELVTTMPMEPNNAVLGALLGGCRIHKDVELASRVGGWLYPDDHLVLLANVYAAAKRWDGVMRAWERMAKMGVRKPAGRSYIQVNGVIHDFVAGDETHQEAADIYKIVREVMTQADSLGEYMSDDSIE
ncbi:hypothetical protein AAC387_Pa01g2697 [Persea americana]